MKHVPLLAGLLALVMLALLLTGGTSASRPAPAVGSEAPAVAADQQTASAVSDDVNCNGSVDANRVLEPHTTRASHIECAGDCRVLVGFLIFMADGKKILVTGVG